MLEPVSRSVSQDVFGFQSVFASKFLDSYSVFDWGRMPDSIPFRGKFQNDLQAFIHQKISSADEWKKFLRSPDALAFRKAGVSASHLNELADHFPMKSSFRGILTDQNFHSGKLEPQNLTAELVRTGAPFYLIHEPFAEEKVNYVTVLGKTAWDFGAWKIKQGPKTLPFEFVCEFDGVHHDFPKVTLHWYQQSFSSEVTLTEALLITELSARKLEEGILRAAWIAGFVHFNTKFAEGKKTIRVRLGMEEVSEYSPYVFLAATLDFAEIEEELQKFYSSTLWGKVVGELQLSARVRGHTDWKRQCMEPAPWLDSGLKNNFSNQYQKMIAGIAACLSE